MVTNRKVYKAHSVCNVIISNMAKNLESIVNSSSKNNSIKVKQTWLAKKLNNPNKGLLGKMLDYIVGAGATAAAYSVIGIPAIVAAGVSIAGDYFGNRWRSAKTTSSQLRDSLLFSSVLSPIGYTVLSWLNSAIDIQAPYGLIKRTLAQIALFQGTIAPVANHFDYLVRHKTLDVGEAHENQFKKFFFQNIGWSVLAGLVPVGLAYSGYGVDTQFYGGLAAGVAVRGLAWGRQIEGSDPYGTYNGRNLAAAKPKYTAPAYGY